MNMTLDLKAVARCCTIQVAVLLSIVGPNGAYAQDAISGPTISVEILPAQSGGHSSTITNAPDLAPILSACLFSQPGEPPAALSTRDFALACVAPYVTGLWLDPTVLYRSHDDIVAQATDRLVSHPDGEPFPVFAPAVLIEDVRARLAPALDGRTDVVIDALPDPLPAPSLDPDSLYNSIGLLYLPNPYVVPGETFNEMYGWDSYFIIRGLLASIDHVMANPEATVWSPSDRALTSLSSDPDSPHYHRDFAERLFETAKGMVDNHIFEIAFYGGFVPNANRTYYLTRSQPPLFTQEAIAVYEAARRYGFDYTDTLSPYLSQIDPDYEAPDSFDGWIAHEVLPAAERYYAYWTDPDTVWGTSSSNPRVREVEHEGASHPVYFYGTDGVGPAPEVARSTQPQNRAIYRDDATYLQANPNVNVDNRFYNAETTCADFEAVGNCGDPTYGLTQDYYAADRGLRASGFDLSNRFGDAGQWAMDYAPISLNVLLLVMAEDIDRLAMIAGESPRNDPEALADRRSFLADFFLRPDGTGFGDRLVNADRAAGAPEFAYAYATQTYLLWAGVLAPRAASDLVQGLQASQDGLTFLPAAAGSTGSPQYGIPTSLIDTGKQWDAPYAWAPIQYFAVNGLIANGFSAEAAWAMENWIAAVNAFFAADPVIIEKYDVRDPTDDPRVRIGYAHAQRGFGWTNATYMLFANWLYSAP